MKEWLAYVPFRIGVLFFGSLPESVIRAIGRWLGDTAARLQKSKHPLLASHMRKVMGQGATDAEISEAVSGMFRSYARYWTETLWFKPSRRTFILDNTERINFGPVHKAIAERRSIVFVVPHIGNWEIAGIVADDLGLNLMAVAEDLPNRRITEWFLNVRLKFGIDIVLTTDPARRSKMVKLLKSGGALALVADRDVTGTGTPVTFFGEETTMPTGPAALAGLTDSALIPVAVYFKQGAGWRIEVGDTVELPEASSRTERTRLVVEQLAGAMEKQIRKQPSQWHLFQPNWPSDDKFDQQSGP